MIGVLMKRGRFGHRDRRLHVKVEAEMEQCVYKSRYAKGSWQLVEARRDLEGSLPLEPLEEVWPCQHLDIGPLASRTGEDTFLLC